MEYICVSLKIKRGNRPVTCEHLLLFLLLATVPKTLYHRNDGTFRLNPINNSVQFNQPCQGLSRTLCICFCSQHFKK